MIAKDQGFILRRYNFRETSLIAIVYTRDHGKVSLLFKGFYTPKREFTASLDIFTLNEFIFYPKRRELWLASFADQSCDYAWLRKSYRVNNVAALCSSIADRVLPMGDINPQIFELLRAVFEALAVIDAHKVLYVFLLKILAISGFEPELDHCSSCACHLDGQVFFSASCGGMLCPGCRSKFLDAKFVKNDIFKSMRYIQQHEFPNVFRLQLSAVGERGLFFILREFVLYHLDIDILPALPQIFSPLALSVE